MRTIRRKTNERMNEAAANMVAVNVNGARLSINTQMNIASCDEKKARHSILSLCVWCLCFVRCARCRWHPTATQHTRAHCVNYESSIFLWDVMRWQRFSNCDPAELWLHWQRRPNVMRWKIISCCRHVFNSWSFSILTSRAHIDGYATNDSIIAGTSIGTQHRMSKIAEEDSSSFSRKSCIAYEAGNHCIFVYSKNLQSAALMSRVDPHGIVVTIYCASSCHFRCTSLPSKW